MAKKIRIGRDKTSDVVLNDSSVSRHHAELIVHSQGNYEIIDLESSGGTFIFRDGKMVSVSRARLAVQDQLRLGELDISLKDILSRAGDLPGALAGAPSPQPKARPGRMIRCACGSVKPKGAPCPSCGH